MSRCTSHCIVAWLFPAAMGAAAVAATVFPSHEEVLLVNGQAVSAEEFKWFMEQERSHVVARFATRYGLEYGKGFWTHSVEGKTPRMSLEQATVSRLVREKVEQALFLELGLVNDIRYSWFLKDLDQINREREQAVREGRVVYGPVRYPQLAYYSHWKTGLQIRAKEKLAQGRFGITEGTLKAFYEENRGRFKSVELFDLEIATVESPSAADTGNPATASESMALRILSRLRAGESMGQATGGPSEGVRISSRRFNQANAERIGELFGGSEVQKRVTSLIPGGSMIVTHSHHACQVVQCLGRSGNAVLPYEEVKERVRAAYVQKQYDRLITELASKAKVGKSQEVIDSLLP
jgi:hypothetical protein